MAINLNESKIEAPETNTLFKKISIGDKIYYDHRVFGLVDEKWFFDHGVKPTDTGIPCVKKIHPSKGEVLVIDPKFAEAEKRYSEFSRMTKEERNRLAVAENELATQAQRIFN
jgi:DNA polymerase III epsilon subunit-like protein